MAGPVPEERVERPFVEQTWRHVTFIHWRVAPRDILRLLPTRLRPDVVDGSAWVSLVAFRVDDLLVLGRRWQGRSSFPETNLRTYVRDERGRDWIWFFSLDAASLLNVIGGRMVGVPYHLSTMSVDEIDGRVRYRCRRRSGAGAGHDLVVERGELMDDPGLSVAEELAGRWRAVVRRAGSLLEVPVEHEPWSLFRGRLLSIDESLFAAAGLDRPGDDPTVSCAGDVHARLGRPRKTSNV